MSDDRLKPLFKTKSGRHLNAGVLPVSLFASGHTFFVSRMAHLMHTTPFMVHTTFQYGGVQASPAPRAPLRHARRRGCDGCDHATPPLADQQPTAARLLPATG